MDFAGHKRIKDFSIDGTIYDDSDFMRLRQRYQTMIEDYMRIKGYIPHLDIDCVFTTGYNGNSFEFKITAYGIYVGKAKAKCYQGVTGNKLIPMISMTASKLEKSSQSVESQ
jgi:hypothetical protein